jgi:hypothetical protein
MKQALERHIAEGEPYSPQLVMNAIVEVGGMITAPLLSMFVIPAAYMLLQRAQHDRFVRPEPLALFDADPGASHDLAPLRRLRLYVARDILC